MNIRMRKENRQKSVIDMVERTRQINAGILRTNPSRPDMLPDDYDLSNIAQIPVPRTRQQQMSNSKQNDEVLRRNSQKYDDMMKMRRDELKRKRGALELNSDLDVDTEF